MSTSNGSLALSFSASRLAAPVSSLAKISSRLMRPEPNISPLEKTMGTAMTWRCSTSAWNRPPSTMVALILGLKMVIKVAACTTSGQLWHDKDM